MADSNRSSGNGASEKRFSEKRSSEYVDHVECMSCGTKQYVPKGSSKCLACGDSGTLAWAEEKETLGAPGVAEEKPTEITVQIGKSDLEKLKEMALKNEVTVGEIAAALIEKGLPEGEYRVRN